MSPLAAYPANKSFKPTPLRGVGKASYDRGVAAAANRCGLIQALGRHFIRRHTRAFVVLYFRFVANRLQARLQQNVMSQPRQRDFPMKKPSAGLLICCGTAVASAVSYDASALTELLGMSAYGGEGLVALSGLVLSTLFIAVGTHGVTRQWIRGAPRAAA